MSQEILFTILWVHSVTIMSSMSFKMEKENLAWTNSILLLAWVTYMISTKEKLQGLAVCRIDIYLSLVCSYWISSQAWLQTQIYNSLFALVNKWNHLFLWMTIQSVQPFEFNHLLKIWIIQVFESTCVFFNKHHNDCQDDGRWRKGIQTRRRESELCAPFLLIVIKTWIWKFVWLEFGCRVKRSGLALLMEIPCHSE